MKAISYDKLVQIYELSKRFEQEDYVNKLARENIERNERLTIKEKIIVEMWTGLWNNKVYSGGEICKLFELTHNDLNKLFVKVKEKRVCHCGGLKGFLDD